MIEIDKRKECKTCSNLALIDGPFEANYACVILGAKLTINKEAFDKMQKYWDMTLKVYEIMPFNCPGYNKGIM